MRCSQRRYLIVGSLMNKTHIKVVTLQPSRFVTVKMAAALTGLTDRAIRTKLFDGTWLEGRQFRRRGAAIFIDMQGYERWVDNG